MSANLHIDHIEDQIFTRPLYEMMDTIADMRHFKKFLSGDGGYRNHFRLGTKWDGSPAIFAGTDPYDDAFFVAKKSLFNKEPKLYKSKQQILDDASLQPKLKELFCLAFSEFSRLQIESGRVYQGDIMFTKDTLREFDVDGLLTFHPNTIVYGVPSSSDIADEMRAAEIGVIWHTAYKGDDLRSNMDAFVGDPITELLAPTSRVWMRDATFMGNASINADQQRMMHYMLKFVESITKELVESMPEYYPFFDMFHADPVVLERLKVYINSFIRDDNDFPLPIALCNGFIEELNAWFDREIDAKKSVVGKDNWRVRKNNVMRILTTSKIPLEKMFSIFQYLREIKTIVVKALDSRSTVSCMFRKGDLFEQTHHEGFVFQGENMRMPVKFVDRRQFSYANFGKVDKGWI